MSEVSAGKFSSSVTTAASAAGRALLFRTNSIT